VSVALAVTHAPWDAQRRAWVARLQRDVSPQPLHVVSDTRRDRWDTTRRAWLRLATQPARYALVLQDDLAVVPGFVQHAVDATVAADGAVLSFFTYTPFAADCAARSAWFVDDALWGACLGLPVEALPTFLAWTARWITPSYGPTDKRVWLFARAHELPILTATHSLVRHLGAGHSLIGHRFGHVDDPPLATRARLDWQVPPEVPCAPQRPGRLAAVWREARSQPVELSTTDSGWRPHHVPSKSGGD